MIPITDDQLELLRDFFDEEEPPQDCDPYMIGPETFAALKAAYECARMVYRG